MATGKPYVAPRKVTGRVPLRSRSSADVPFSYAAAVSECTRNGAVRNGCTHCRLRFVSRGTGSGRVPRPRRDRYG